MDIRCLIRRAICFRLVALVGSLSSSALFCSILLLALPEASGEDPNNGFAIAASMRESLVVNSSAVEGFDCFLDYQKDEAKPTGEVGLTEIRYRLVHDADSKTYLVAKRTTRSSLSSDSDGSGIGSTARNDISG